MIGASCLWYVAGAVQAGRILQEFFTQVSCMDLNKLEQLHALREKGAISEEEFTRAKAKLLGEQSVFNDVSVNLDNRNYSMLMHFAQLLCFLFPVVGWAVPLVMWQIKKEDDYIDQQGRIVCNWILSSLVYTLIGIVLAFILIGFLWLFALFVCSVIFIIMGGLRARDGEIRNYPLTISFLSVRPIPALPGPDKS